jgi:hypothetical protein
MPTFFRKDESDGTAFLVIINIGKTPNIEETVDFRFETKRGSMLCSMFSAVINSFR